MDRRLVGGLLFVVVLTLAVVLPTLGGLRDDGVATAIQLAQDPQVGDCVLESLTDIVPIPSAGSGSSLAPSFVSCDGRNVAGEVVAVVRATGEDRARLQQVADSGVDCNQSSLKYSGLVQDDGRYLLADHSSADPVDWDLTLNMRSAWVLPSPMLRSAGRTWVACIAAPASGASYRGRLAGAFKDGALPNEFGVCWEKSTPSVTTGSVPCSAPHLAEQVSTGTISDGGKVAIADINSSCQRLAAQIIGRSDPTAAGRLAVGTSVSPDVAQFLRLPQPLNVICYVAAVGRPLSGTLVGLRDRPIPYSG